MYSYSAFIVRWKTAVRAIFESVREINTADSLACRTNNEFFFSKDLSALHYVSVSYLSLDPIDK